MYDFLRRHYPHQVKGRSSITSSQPAFTSSPVFIYINYISEKYSIQELLKNIYMIFVTSIQKYQSQFHPLKALLNFPAYIQELHTFQAQKFQTCLDKMAPQQNTLLFHMIH